MLEQVLNRKAKKQEKKQIVARPEIWEGIVDARDYEDLGKFDRIFKLG